MVLLRNIFVLLQMLAALGNWIVSTTTQLLTLRELQNMATTDLNVVAGIDCHMSFLEPPTWPCTHSQHTCCNVHTVSSGLDNCGLHAVLQTDENQRVLTHTSEGSWKELLLSTPDSCYPQKLVERMLALWPARAQEWAGQHAAYARCGDVWTPPRRSHPSHAEEGSRSGEWCIGSPRGFGFLDLGFLSSEVAHRASPATGGSAELIHWGTRCEWNIS